MPDPELVFLLDFGSVFEVLGCKLTFFFSSSGKQIQGT